MARSPQSARSVLRAAGTCYDGMGGHDWGLNGLKPKGAPTAEERKHSNKPKISH